MKTKIYFLVFFVVIIFINNSCKKYPQGPSFSLQSKSSRLSQHWKLSQYFYDHFDHTTDFMQNYVAYQINITQPNLYGGAPEMNIYTQSYMPLNGTTHTVQVEGTWELSDDETELLFSETYILDNQKTTPSTSYVRHDYVIVKLYEKSLALQENIDGHSFEYFFVPQ